MDRFREIIQKVARGEKLSKDLTREEAHRALQWIFEGKAGDFEIGAFFAAMRMKGESAEETVGFVEAVRERAAQLHPEVPGVLDLGEPYDGKIKTLHLSVPVAGVLASAGVPVVLHSAPETPVKKGVETQGVLEALESLSGRPTQDPPHVRDRPPQGPVPVVAAVECAVSLSEASTRLQAILEKENFVFLPTEKLAPDFAKLRPYREAFGLRPFANHIEKIFNLANAEVQMVGVYHRPYLEVMAETLTKLGIRKFFVIQGVEGFTELFISRKTLVLQGKEGRTETFWMDAAEYGLKGEEDGVPAKALDHVKKIQCILALERGPARQSLLWNAAVKLFWMQKVPSIGAGLREAEAILDSGKLAEKMKGLTRFQ